MNNTLFDIYAPLILWTGLGLFLFRFMPQALPRLLGRILYWVGVPIEIFALARQTNFSENWGLAPVITLAALGVGLGLASLSWQGWRSLASQSQQQSRGEQKQGLFPAMSLSWFERSRQGSFILAAMLGNTGFVGLAIAPAFISPDALKWAVFFSVTHNIFGPYVFGVLVASYFGRSSQQQRWWVYLRDIVTVPCLWTFILGYLTLPIEFPPAIESGLQASIAIVSCSAFVLIGMRLSQISGWKSFRTALIPSSLKVIVLPGLVGLGTTFLGLSGDPRLALVLMSGMPTAFMGLILAEEYDLDRELIASSIFVSTILLLLIIPFWLFLF
jgi:malate permease and related proteins